MRIEILNTGTELLLGSTLNTHGHWMGQELLRMGLRVQRQVTVPDGEAINEALGEAVMRADAVLVTGGLGPTSDDVTREATAEVLGIELMEDEQAVRELRGFFEKRGYDQMPESNLKQALVPVGADVLPNPNGTAPGIYIPPRLGKASACAVFLLPGPPRELRPMFLAEVVPRLRALSGIEEAGGIVELKFVGIGESAFHEGIDERLQMVEGLEFGYCARLGEVDLRLIGRDESIAEARGIVEAEFGRYLVSDDGSGLPEVVVGEMTKRGLKLATAESCTGGLIASRVTDVPGASEVFTHGFVVYANEAKRGILGVPEEKLSAFGAVSEEVCEEMVTGALEKSGADWAIGVTGIAGPGGGSEDKPVGLVYIGVGRKGEEPLILEKNVGGDRSAFKWGVSQIALAVLRRRVLGQGDQK